MENFHIFVFYLKAMELHVQKEKPGRKGTPYLTEQLHARVSGDAKRYLDQLVEKSGYKPSFILDSMLLYFKGKRIEFVRKE